MKLKRFKDNNISEDEWEISTNTELIKINPINIKKNNNIKIYFLSILLLLTLSSIYFINHKTKSVFKQYYTTENVLNITRGNNKSIDAIIEFQNKNFETSSYMFKQILNEDDSNITIRFYYGISCIETENYEESIKSFKFIIENNKNLYVEHAKWYLALCYLKIGKKEDAINQFEIIKEDKNNYYRKKAEIILKKIK